MKKIMFMLFLTISLLVFCSSAFAYEQHEPILIENIHATADDPYVIEGYEITNPGGNCIEVMNSEHVIIRDNYLHGCGNSLEKEYPHYDGLAIIAGDSKHITIENNKVIDNLNGILAYNSANAIIRNNTIKKSKVWVALLCEICDDSKFYNNYIEDNGVPEWFWEPGERICGLYILRSNNVEIYDNTIIRSSSDGIRVIGQIECGITEPEDEWGGTTNYVKIYNNLVLDNMELGFAFDRGRNFEVYNNTIRSSCTGPAGCICFEFDVDDSKFYDNKLIPCVNPFPFQMSCSQRNHIYNNTAYYIPGKKEEFVQVEYDSEGDIVKSGWAGIPHERSADNIIENNKWKKIGGELAAVLQEKLKVTEKNNLIEEKGWFACEISEGVFDQECVERERSKGIQGKSRKYIVIDPLYENPEDYVVEENHIIKITACLVFMLSLILIIIAVIWKKRKKKY